MATLYRMADGQLVIDTSLPSGATVVTLSSTNNPPDLIPWYRDLDTPDLTEWHPAKYYSGIPERVFVASNTATGNISFGDNYTGRTDTAFGTNNIAFGAGALRVESSGKTNNVGIGFNALNSCTTGDNNVAIGTEAQLLGSTGSNNISLGYHTLFSNSTGTNNIAFGTTVLSDGGAPSSCIGIGDVALFKCNSSYNIGIGELALSNTTSGASNIAIGPSAGINNITGFNNIYIGNFAGDNVLQTAGSDNLYIGNFTASFDTGSSNVLIGTDMSVGDATSGNIVIGANSTERLRYAANVDAWKTTSQFRFGIDGASGIPSVYLNGATSNSILFNNNGVASPAFTTRSAGTKIVYYSTISGSSSEYATGIDANTLWNSIPTSTHLFRWYAGTTSVARLTGDGDFLVTGNILSLNPTGGTGYGPGAGGTVTQLTSKTTGVTLNKVCGKITMHAASLAADATAAFTMTNSAITDTDVVITNVSGTGVSKSAYLVNCNSIVGGVEIRVRNISTGALAEAVEIKFAVIKGVIA